MKGRPSKYNDSIAKEILDRLMGGESLRSICDDDHMPDERTVRRWAVDDVQGFSPHYAAARDMGLDAMADELLEIADDGTNDWMERKAADGSITEVANAEHIQRSRLRVDTRKWLLSKMAPKRYGEKMQHTGDGGGPIESEVTKIERVIVDHRSSD